MTLLHDAMIEILRPLADAGFVWFEADWKRKYEWNFFPNLVSYWCSVHEGKDILFVAHSVAERRPCVARMVTINDIHDLGEGDQRQLRQTIFVREIYIWLVQKMSGWIRKTFKERQGTWFELPKKSFLYQLKCEPFLEGAGFEMRRMLPDMYRLFTSQPLHSFHTGI